MPAVEIGPNNICVFGMNPQDSGGTPRAATGTLTIDNYSAAYVASRGGGSYVIVPKGVPPSAITVTVTAAGTAQSGATIPSASQQFVLDPNAATPDATEFNFFGFVVRDTVGFDVPPDPGSASISLA